MTTFERIKHLAKQRGYTLTALNDKAGLGTNSIYHWKNKTPSTQSLNKVAKVLGVSTDYLLGNDNTIKKDGLSVDEAVDNLRPYQGIPVSDDQKEVIKDLIKGYLNQKNNR
jgi:transcriptional regulator with XRE-family HTH domain